jgi:hypothetical protein
MEKTLTELGCIIYGALALVPLGLWKLIELLLAAASHVRFVG